MISLFINNKIYSTELDPITSLATFIREELNLQGTKTGCFEGDCGSCSVITGEFNQNKIIYRSINSCITPIQNVEGKSIFTIEGIDKDQLWPIIDIFTDESATQCGFCTPGFMISITSYLLSLKPLEYNYEDLIDAVTGNICRCTGYGSIKRALKRIVDEKIMFKLDNKLIDYKLVKPIGPQLAINQKVVAGGTDLLVNRQFLDDRSKSDLHFLISRDDKQLGAMTTISFKKGVFEIGSLVTMNDLKINKDLNDYFNFKSVMRKVASNQVRNSATVAGNIANGSPIGDLSIIFLALDSSLVLTSRKGERIVKLHDFYSGYKKSILFKDEIITKIQFKVPTSRFIFSFEKIGKREFLDLAEVNSAMLIVFENENKDAKDNRIREISLSMGGVSPVPMMIGAIKDFQFQNISSIDNSMFIDVEKKIQKEIAPIDPVKYKRMLVRQQLFIHLNGINNSLTLEALL